MSYDQKDPALALDGMNRHEFRALVARAKKQATKVRLAARAKRLKKLISAKRAAAKEQL